MFRQHLKNGQMKSMIAFPFDCRDTYVILYSNINYTEVLLNSGLLWFVP